MAFGGGIGHNYVKSTSRSLPSRQSGESSFARFTQTSDSTHWQQLTET